MRVRSDSVLVDADGEADPLGQQVPERDVLDRVVLLLHVLRHLVLHVLVLLLVVRLVVLVVPAPAAEREGARHASAVAQITIN